MRIAVVGATGLVGSKMLQVLDEQHITIDELIVAASERSLGKEIVFRGKVHRVVRVEEAIEACPDIAIFSAGASASRLYAPMFAEKGCYVVDNSSAWRMFPEIPLVVPEINADTITKDTHIIANPNCSTIEMVLALAPLHQAFDIKRLVIATYQSVSGSGLKGIAQLEREEGERLKVKGERFQLSPFTSPLPNAYPHQIYRNVLPHGGDFCENGYTTEEEKLVNETRKILRAPQVAITATVCRVPVTGGHSEAVNIEFNKPFELDEVRRLLENYPGIVVQDDPAHNVYPMAITAYDRDEVFVGRIRRDFSVENGLNLWVVSDNIRKGAATNAVQIAKYLIENIL